MKKIALTLLIAISFSAQAQFVTIPDPAFRIFLMQNYFQCFNGLQQMDTTCNAIVNAKSLNFPVPPNAVNITTLNGIQYFDNLDTIFKFGGSIGSLQYIPERTKHLTLCSNNIGGAILHFPDSLLYIDIRENQITSLPILPTKLEVLACGENWLTSLPALPNTLRSLYCGTYAIVPPAAITLASLPLLPMGLDTLDASYQELTSLPDLPSGLTCLNLYFNALTTFPKLPNGLKYLDISHNHFGILPTLPDSLKVLACEDVMLTSLPALPDSLEQLWCPYNALLDCLPHLPPNLVSITCHNTPISCLPNNVNGLNLILPLCNNGTTCAPDPYCSGVVFHDLNNNGVYDAATDEPVQYGTITNTNHWVSTSYQNGEYLMKLDSGINNTLTCHLPNPYFTISPANYSMSPMNVTSQGNNYDFKVGLIPNIYDLRIDIAKGGAHPGFTQWVTAIINNDGTESAVNATVKLKKPYSFIFLNANPPISQQVADTLIWNNVNIDIFKNKTFSVNLGIPVNAINGAPYSMKAWIVAANGDTTPNNNFINDDGTITGSYDPNDKTVSAKTIDEFTTGEMKYTIRFQNTGTDTAFNITIKDELNSNLDLSTFQMLGASHNYIYQIREKGLLEVFFPNIMLPDSNVNEPRSHGFFQYIIKSKPNLTINDSITNTASIYFDFNATVVTNTVTTKVIVEGLSEFSKIDANIYPNPTTGKAVVSISESSGTLTISDMKGSIIIKAKIKNGDEVHLSRLQNGIYIAKIETEKGFKFLKIVKQD